MCQTCDALLSWTRRAFDLPLNKLNSDLTNTLSIYLFKFCTLANDHNDEKYVYAKHILYLANKYFIDQDTRLIPLIKLQLDTWFELYDNG